jgi:D-arabinose 1-dehydrogenase-like Zn-dependent alcohol dehydrogenase
LRVKADSRDLRQLANLVTENELRPQVQVVPFAEWQHAYQLLEAGKVKGKIVVEK